MPSLAPGPRLLPTEIVVETKGPVAAPVADNQIVIERAGTGSGSAAALTLKRGQSPMADADLDFRIIMKSPPIRKITLRPGPGRSPA
jgi:hypothetical protein